MKSQISINVLLTARKGVFETLGIYELTWPKHTDKEGVSIDHEGYEHFMDPQKNNQDRSLVHIVLTHFSGHLN